MTPSELVKGLYEDCLNPRLLERLPEYLFLSRASAWM